MQEDIRVPLTGVYPRDTRYKALPTQGNSYENIHREIFSLTEN